MLVEFGIFGKQRIIAEMKKSWSLFLKHGKTTLNLLLLIKETFELKNFASDAKSILLAVIRKRFSGELC